MNYSARGIARWSIAVALIGSLSLACAEVSTKISERTRQKQAAEQERADLRQKLGELKEDILKTEKARGYAADALAASEAAISNANRLLRELINEQTKTEQRLMSLSKTQEELEASVRNQRGRLKKILTEQYLAGHDDRVRLILSGDNPNRISRELRYLGYASAAQTRAIEGLQVNLAAVETNKAEAEEVRLTLQEIAQEQREQKAVLEKEKANRQILVGQLSSKLDTQRKEAGNLARNEERLSSLVERLASIIAKQRKEEEAAEARKRAQQAKEAALRERDSAKANAKTKPSGKPAPVIAKDKPKSSSDDAVAIPVMRDDSAFASLRGKLHMPVKGELFASFGTRRSDGPSWKGLFIKAPEGTEVKAAAAGEVIFADWMRGFGNLLIIDHGDQYMTVYANNQSVLKRPGDKVRAGDVIAAAGNSGGNEHSGLYFEMRYQGRAIDPLAWINR